MDYSKFDNINTDSDEDDDDVQPSPVVLPPTQQEPNPTPPMPTKMTKKTDSGRLKFEYEGRTIYEWEQSLEEVY